MHLCSHLYFWYWFCILFYICRPMYHSVWLRHLHRTFTWSLYNRHRFTENKHYYWLSLRKLKIFGTIILFVVRYCWKYLNGYLGFARKFWNPSHIIIKYIYILLTILLKIILNILWMLRKSPRFVKIFLMII